MNDRYLFKAKRKNWRELPKEEWWVQGCYVKYQPHSHIEEFVYGIVPDYASALYIIEIDETTLCQCISWRDKDKVLIWENDIVKIGTFEYLIWWNREGQEMTAVPIKGICFNGTDYYSGCNPNFTYHDFICMMQEPYGDFINKIEVVGNAIDNPELLEVEHDGE